MASLDFTGAESTVGLGFCFAPMSKAIADFSVINPES